MNQSLFGNKICMRVGWKTKVIATGREVYDENPCSIVERVNKEMYNVDEPKNKILWVVLCGVSSHSTLRKRTLHVFGAIG